MSRPFEKRHLYSIAFIIVYPIQSLSQLGIGKAKGLDSEDVVRIL